MPPAKKFTKEEIIDAACTIIEQEGLSSLNARSLSEKLSGSVQIIYHNFKTMDELQQEVYIKIHKIYEENIKSANDDKRPYLKKGLAYVMFARDHPEYYKLLFMNNTPMNLDEFFTQDKSLIENVQDSINKVFKVQQEEINEFHKKVWIFSHGLACLLATKTVSLEDEELEHLLVDTVNELYIGYKEKINEKNN